MLTTWIQEVVRKGKAAAKGRVFTLSIGEKTNDQEFEFRANAEDLRALHTRIETVLGISHERLQESVKLAEMTARCDELQTALLDANPKSPLEPQDNGVLVFDEREAATEFFLHAGVNGGLKAFSIRSLGLITANGITRPFFADIDIEHGQPESELETSTVRFFDLAGNAVMDRCVRDRIPYSTEVSVRRVSETPT